MALQFRGWALDHPASFRFALGLSGHRTEGQTLMRRLPRLSVPPASVLGWATLCGLVLLELDCDREDLPEDIGKLCAAAVTADAQRIVDIGYVGLLAESQQTR
jgi:hypothetical protein